MKYLLIPLLIPFLTFGQRFKTEFIIQRIPVTDSTEYVPQAREKITLIFFSDSVRLVTRRDTLILKRLKHITENTVYVDRIGQRYHVVFYLLPNGSFCYRFTPMLPHVRNRLYAINLYNI